VICVHCWLWRVVFEGLRESSTDEQVLRGWCMRKGVCEAGGWLYIICRVPAPPGGESEWLITSRGMSVVSEVREVCKTGTCSALP
jgi:hypothetical protein